MSNQTDTILRESTADMWRPVTQPAVEQPAPKKRNVRRTSAVVASVAVVAMTMAAEAHHRRHSARPMQVMCDNVDLMRPCYNGYRPFEPDRPRHVASLSRHRHVAQKPAPVLAASHNSGEREPSVTSARAGVGMGRGVVKSSTGAVAYVAEKARAAFQCLIDKLETEGYRIRDMGGFASSGHIRHSLHYSGLAMDVNQLSRNVTNPPMPKNEIYLANSCGLVSGAQWHDADSGHFQLGGYDGHVPNIRMASHRHHHRHYARRHVRDHRYASYR